MNRMNAIAEDKHAMLIQFVDTPYAVTYSASGEAYVQWPGGSTVLSLVGYAQVSVEVVGTANTRSFDVLMGKISGATLASWVASDQPADMKIHTYPVVGPEIGLVLRGTPNTTDHVQLWVHLSQEAMSGVTHIVGANTVAGLRALAGGANSVAVLAGYSTASDGGGGMFVWSTASLVDDGGTIFNANGRGGAATASWCRMYTGAVSIAWFGAVPNSASSAAANTDATSAIQAAIDAAKANGGGIVFFPSGRYRIERPLELRGLHDPPSHSGISLMGVGAHYSRSAQLTGSWLVWGGAADSSKAMLKLACVQDFALEGLGFYGGPSAGVTAIRITSDNNPASFSLSLRRFAIAYCAVGIEIGDGLNENQADHVAIEQFSIIGCSKAGIRINGGNAADYSLIQGGQFMSTGEMAIDLRVSGSVNISCCAAGGQPTSKFIHATGYFNNLLVENCQAEKIASFLEVTPAEGTPNDAQQIVLIGNTVNVPIRILGVTRIVGLGNYYTAPIELASGARWMGVGERLRGAAGARLARAPGASFTNLRSPFAATFGEYYAEGEIIVGASAQPHALASVVTRGGIHGVPYRATSVYRVGDVVAGTNGHAYRVTQASTTPAGAEPAWATTETVHGAYRFVDLGEAASVASVGVARSGLGSPEGVVLAPVGALYTRTDGTPGATLYVKESGITAIGWVAK